MIQSCSGQACHTLVAGSPRKAGTQDIDGLPRGVQAQDLSETSCTPGARSSPAMSAGWPATPAPTWRDFRDRQRDEGAVELAGQSFHLFCADRACGGDGSVSRQDEWRGGAALLPFGLDLGGDLLRAALGLRRIAGAEAARDLLLPESLLEVHGHPKTGRVDAESVEGRSGHAESHPVSPSCITGAYEDLAMLGFPGFPGYWTELAEREGFEPPMELPPCRISSAVHSTTLPSLREIENRTQRSWQVDTG